MSTTPEDLERVTSLVLQFLESKAFFGAERALRTELALALEACERDPSALQKHSLFASELEQLLPHRPRRVWRTIVASTFSPASSSSAPRRSGRRRLW